MKFAKRALGIILSAGIMLLSGQVNAAESYKPFILASTGTGNFQTVLGNVQSDLKKAGFDILATYEPDLSHYHPYQAAAVVIVTDSDLLSAAAKTSRGGYGAVMRVSVTQANGSVQVAYTNPEYVRYAYRMGADLSSVKGALAKALGDKESFGSKGLTADQLENYHYTFGMEYFNEPYNLNQFSSHARAVATVATELKRGVKGLHYVYQLDIPGTDQTVFGVSMDSNEDQNVNDAYQMSVVDFGNLKGTAYLPYQILVNGSRVEALNMRFRMAVFFPDLSMMGDHSFMTLMSAPAALHKALAKAAGSSYSHSVF